MHQSYKCVIWPTSINLGIGIYLLLRSQEYMRPPKESVQTIRIAPKCQQTEAGRDRESYQGEGQRGVTMTWRVQCHSNEKNSERESTQKFSGRQGSFSGGT